MHQSSSPVVQYCQPTSAATPSPSKASKANNAKTLQPKKSSSSPLSKIKFHSISKRRMSGGQKLNMNEKFQLIKKHGTSSSSSSGSGFTVNKPTKKTSRIINFSSLINNKFNQFFFLPDDYDTRQNEVIKTEELTYNNHSPSSVSSSHRIALCTLIFAVARIFLT